MKNFKHFSIILTGVFLLWACQKELSLESANGSNGQATGSLKDTSNNCLPIVVKGNYLQDSTLTDSNYVLVQANVVTAGSYLIYTDFVNGYSFRDSGFITTTGLQIFKLKGKGKPILSGPNDFTVAFGSSLCTFNVIASINSAAAVYSLGTTAGVCTGTNVGGSYTAGSPLSTANKVDISVTVTTPGTYSISTVTTGGMTFSASGSFAATGVQTVSLQGTGTPTAAGTINIPVTAGVTSCSFNVTVQAAGSQAVFTLGATAGTCTNANIQGTYTVGTTLTAANKVVVTVNVTTAGAYTISTGVTGGMSFSATGTFTTTGVQTVTLTGSGTPNTTGNNTLMVNGGGSACSFAISVAAAAPVNQSDTAWSFNQGATFFKGKFDTAFTTTIPGLGFAMILYGTSTNVAGDTMEIDVLFPGATVQPGTYVTTGTSAFYLFNATTDIYSADLTTITTPAICTVIITNYDAVTKIVQGTFSGSAENAAGIAVPITNGKFKAQLK